LVGVLRRMDRMFARPRMSVMQSDEYRGRPRPSRPINTQSAWIRACGNSLFATTLSGDAAIPTLD
jgi:hypothetical protein